MRLRLRPRTANEILGDLNEAILVAINFLLLPRYTEIDRKRHVVQSRSSGSPVMWLVTPLGSACL